MSTQKIQMVDLKTQYLRLKDDIDEALNKVIESGFFIKGPEVERFAVELSRYLNAQKVVPCANGTDALQIAMMTLDFKPGDEVIVPAFTYVATVEVIVLLGLKPVFIDVNIDDFNLDTKKLEEVFTAKTVGIVPVHLFGQCANMEDLMMFARKKGLKVIEDTAQAIGSEYSFSDGCSQYAGTIGDIGTTSFFPSKNLGCFGDGGALITNNMEFGSKAATIANHGQSQKYIHDIVGVNSRLDTLQASILLVKLHQLNDFASRRNVVASKYDEAFENVEEIIIPKRSFNSSHVFHQYTIQLEDNQRDSLKNYLAERGIPSMVYYPIPVHLQKAYSEFGYKSGEFPISEKLSERVLSLPIHTEMQPDQQEYIIDSVRSYFS